MGSFVEAFPPNLWAWVLVLDEYFIRRKGFLDKTRALLCHSLKKENLWVLKKQRRCRKKNP